jgi:hypothetical protein
MTSIREQEFLLLAAEHADAGILLDTNVLLLFLFARFQPAMIGRKRLAKYSVDDADLLLQYTGRFKRLLTTQHVLAETSNLARQIVGGKLGLDLALDIHPLFCLDAPDSFTQCRVEGAEIDLYLFARLGLTDAALASLVRGQRLLLTDDLDLYLGSLQQGRAVINFSHMREAAGTV